MGLQWTCQKEMERARFKRPEIQKQRQTNINTLGSSYESSQHVPRVLPSRAQKPSPVQGVISPAVLARRIPIDMELPASEGPSLWAKRAKWRRRRQFAIRGMALAMMLVITLGGLLISQSYMNAHKVFKGTAQTAEALKPVVNPDLLKGEGRGRINILLLGRGGGTHDAPDLTDTIMVASIDPVNHTTSLLSIPRDLWVNVPDAGVMKLNAAWETGEFKYLGKKTAGSTDPKAIQAGYDTVDATLKEVLDIDIDYHVLVNFQAFKQAVDTVGGVTVNVPEDLVDPTMAWENHNDPVLAQAGTQVMDGSKALIYARSRETSSDFARSARQRALLVALKAKVGNLGTLSNPVKISQLMSAFGNNVQTDLSLSSASRLYGIIKGVDDTNVKSISLAEQGSSLVTTGNINGQSVVLPKAGLFQYGPIQNFVRGQLKDPYIIKENASVLILNGTAIPELAKVKADELKSYGYNVTGTDNTPTTDWTQTTLVDLTHKNKYTKNYLEKRLGTKAASSLSDKTIPTNGADFVIIIGSNEASSTQSQAH
jgi:LCP family protein required for cell wall assembly